VSSRPSRAGLYRRLLGLAVLAMLLAGGLLALIPFRGYLGTDEIRVERRRVEIPLAALPVDRAREIAWNDQRLFVGSGIAPVVVAVDYEGGAYLLPDRGVAGAAVSCALFGAVGERFRCMDPAVPAAWRSGASWSLAGEPLGEGFPPLRSIAYRIEGDTLVITASEER
jgi:hypothetical protein